MTEGKNIKSDLIPKIATGFCGGIARTGNICGVVSGAIMAISLFYGRSHPEESSQVCYSIVNKFLTAFEEKFGSTNCRQLIGCDLNTEEGQKIFKENKLIDQCLNYTEEGTRIVMEIIDKQF